MKGNGRVYKPKGSRYWAIDYTVPGVKRFRNSAKCTSKKDAYKLLRKRMGERDIGKVVGNPNDVTIATLRTLTENRYRAAQRKSVDRMLGAFAHLERVFGSDAVALSLTPSRFDAYAARRMKGEKVGDQEIRPVNRATVNYELAVLRRGFTIALKDERIIATMPNFYLPKVQNRRTGFFDDGSFALLINELPAPLHPLIRFLRFTGWRRGEALGLTWDQQDKGIIEWEGHTIRLPGAMTKSGEDRVFPFGAFPALRTLLEEQLRIRDGSYVFQVNGRPINVEYLRKAWGRATKRAGLTGRLVHDLRRTAARDMRRAGLAESDIMELCGWETREMFKRYAIRDEQALARKVGQFASGIVVAQPSPAADPATSLS